MAKNVIEVKPEVLEWAIQNSELPPETLYKKYPWLGKRNPTLIQLEDFAKKARVSFTNLLLGEILEAPPLPLADFRTIADAKFEKPSANLREILYIMELRQEWMRDYCISNGIPPLPFVGSLSRTVRPKTAADKIRYQLGLDVGWQMEHQKWEDALRYFCDVIDESGVMMFSESCLDSHKRFDPEEFRGFTMVDDYAPLIFINSADAPAAQMFTVAHELAHIWLGDSGLYDLRDSRKEKHANSIAAELLVPAELFEAKWQEYQDHPARFEKLSKIFCVSPLVIARRALDLQYIDSDCYWGFFNARQEKWQEEKKTRKAGGGNYYDTRRKHISSSFSFALFQSVNAGETLHRDAYNLLRMSGKTFDKYEEECKNRGR